MKLAAAVALGLFTLPAQAQSNAQPYRALGTEPFWSLAIESGTMRFRPAGGRETRVSRPRPIVGFNGERYVTRRMTVDITHVECSDGMRDRTFHDTVTVTMGRRVLRGCGGEILTKRADLAALLDGDWRIEAINGRPVAPRSRPSVRFSGQRISGNASCNNFSGSFRLRGEQIVSGPLATTRMACTGPALNAQESTVLHILGAPLTVTHHRNGTLVLTNAQRQTLTLAPARS